MHIFLHCLCFFERCRWDSLFGEGGEWIIELSEDYVFESMHDRVNEVASWDGVTAGCIVMPLMIHWGNIAVANAVLESSFNLLDTMMTTPASIGSLTYMMAALATPQMMHMLGRHDACDFMRKMRVDSNNVTATVESWEKAVQVVGEGSVFSPRWLEIMLQITYALVAKDDAVATSVLSMLPSPTELAMLGVVHVPEFGMGPFHSSHMLFLCPMAWPAHLYEQIGDYDTAMACCALALEVDQSKGGDPYPTTRALAEQCRGRVFVALGKFCEAEAAFEAAVGHAQSAELWLLEAMAVQELCNMPNGHGEKHKWRLAHLNVLALEEEIPVLAWWRSSN